MTAASRNPRPAALLLGAVLACVAFPAVAQVRLFPTPAQDEAEPPARPAPTAPSGMAVEDLGGIDADAVGALDDPAEALPARLWADLSRPAIAALLTGLPAETGYPAARDLARRLLLSPGAVPPAETDTPVSLLRARIEALVRLGFARDAARLAAVGADALSGRFSPPMTCPPPAAPPPARRTEPTRSGTSCWPSVRPWRVKMIGRRWRHKPWPIPGFGIRSISP